MVLLLGLTSSREKKKKEWNITTGGRIPLYEKERKKERMNELIIEVAHALVTS